MLPNKFRGSFGFAKGSALCVGAKPNVLVAGLFYL